jgi:hypothetical protein
MSLTPHTPYPTTGTRLSVAILAVAAFASAAIAGCTSRSQSGPGNSPPASSSATTSSAAASPCRASQLTGAVTQQGAMMSQPFAVITLTNTGATACFLTGYPRLTATGHPDWTGGSDGPVSVTIADGVVFELQDPGPGRVDVAPGASASFGLGTQTAIEGGLHIYTLTAVHLTLTADSSTVDVPITIAGSVSLGKPLQIGVTAYVSGATVPAAGRPPSNGPTPTPSS